jgi:hypothetical protein
MTASPPEVVAAFIAAASALVAASIAGLFSLAGLFISKEQDISKFRQAWIDELRKDIASLAAHAHQIHSYDLVDPEDHFAKRWEATREDYIELNSASMRIKLRLNRDECESRLILNSMSEMERLFKDAKSSKADREASLAAIFSIIDALERDVPVLLKKEWERVKVGEPVYRLAKWIAGGVLALSAIAASYFFHQLIR